MPEYANLPLKALLERLAAARAGGVLMSKCGLSRYAWCFADGVPTATPAQPAVCCAQVCDENAAPQPAAPRVTKLVGSTERSTRCSAAPQGRTQPSRRLVAIAVRLLLHHAVIPFGLLLWAMTPTLRRPLPPGACSQVSLSSRQCMSLRLSRDTSSFFCRLTSWWLRPQLHYP